MESKKEVLLSCTKNSRGISIKMCCASCAQKYYSYTGKRLCSLTNERVKALDFCAKWRMSEGLQHAGRFRGGVVRDKDTKKIILK